MRRTDFGGLGALHGTALASLDDVVFVADGVKTIRGADSEKLRVTDDEALQGSFG